MKEALEALKILRELESLIDAYDWMKGEASGIKGERIKKAIHELENFDNELERLRLQVCVTSAVGDMDNLRWKEAYENLLKQNKRG